MSRYDPEEARERERRCRALVDGPEGSRATVAGLKEDIAKFERYFARRKQERQRAEQGQASVDDTETGEDGGDTAEPAASQGGGGSKAAGKAPMREVFSGDGETKSARKDQADMNMVGLSLDEDDELAEGDDAEQPTAPPLSLLGSTSTATADPYTAGTSLLAAVTGDKRGNEPSSDPAEGQVSKGPKLDTDTTPRLGKAKTHDNAKARTDPGNITFVTATGNKLTTAEMAEVMEFWTPIREVPKRRNRIMLDLAAWLDGDIPEHCAFAVTKYGTGSIFSQGIANKCDECEEKGHLCMRRVGADKVVVIGAVGEEGEAAGGGDGATIGGGGVQVAGGDAAGGGVQ